ncbi:unnamed protein product [Rotaria sp. Silwood2]|nr:unnamed protein product [Rotaria sp. Silwood2]
MNNSTANLSENLTSFVYEDLVVHIQAIQYQIIEISKHLNIKWNNKMIRKKLKSRSITFIDPYGNLITNECMDHELISTSFKKYKKNYIAKYLHKWIKIGKMKDNFISPLNEYELKSPVSQYPDGYQFITYGDLNIFIKYHQDIKLEQILLRVLLTDSIEKIKIRLQNPLKIPNIELRLSLLYESFQILKSNDTVLSHQLYKENHIITAHVVHEKTDTRAPKSYFMIFVKLLTRRTLQLDVNADMTIANVKDLIYEKEGIPIDQQRLIFAEQVLDDDGTLSEYKIEHPTMLYLVLRLRGGMYHFTSGRIDFENISRTHAAEAIKNILAFDFKQLNHAEHVSITELQNLVLQGQILLLKLYNIINGLYVSDEVSNLKNIILSNVAGNENDSEDDYDDVSKEKSQSTDKKQLKVFRL